MLLLTVNILLRIMVTLGNMIVNKLLLLAEVAETIYCANTSAISKHIALG